MSIDVNTLEVMDCGSQGSAPEVRSKSIIKVWKGGGVDTYNVKAYFLDMEKLCCVIMVYVLQRYYSIWRQE